MSLYDYLESRRKQAHNAQSAEERKKLDEKNLQIQRDKALAFKKYFGSKDGQEVMLDLMNRFHVLNELPETDSIIALSRAEGARDVVVYLLKRAKVSMDDLDKILRGEF